MTPEAFDSLVAPLTGSEESDALAQLETVLSVLSAGSIVDFAETMDTAMRSGQTWLFPLRAAPAAAWERVTGTPWPEALPGESLLDSDPVPTARTMAPAVGRRRRAEQDPAARTAAAAASAAEPVSPPGPTIEDTQVLTPVGLDAESVTPALGIESLAPTTGAPSSPLRWTSVQGPSAALPVVEFGASELSTATGVAACLPSAVLTGMAPAARRIGIVLARHGGLQQLPQRRVSMSLRLGPGWVLEPESGFGAGPGGHDGVVELVIASSAARSWSSRSAQRVLTGLGAFTVLRLCASEQLQHPTEVDLQLLVNNAAVLVPQLRQP